MLHGTRSILAVGLTVGAVSAAILGGTALTAANDVDESFAGQGEGDISGFDVTDIAYTSDNDTNAVNPQISSVTFSLSRDGSAVVPADANASAFVQLRDEDTPTPNVSDWSTCVITAGEAVCTLTGNQQMAVKDVAALSVVAYDN
jgi:hypothetical protein